LIDGIIFILENPDAAGPFNFCAPGMVRQIDFAKLVGNILHRPAFLPAPAFLMRTILGEFADALLSGQRAYPEKLLETGFKFNYSEIRTALENILTTASVFRNNV
jgi:NAD dependent epimerase/dehydratase family enzyme